MWTDLFIRLRSLVRRKAVETELDEELRFHFEKQVERHLGSGLSREEAHRRVRLEFGGLDQVKEECREARGIGFLEMLVHDTRYAVRTLRKSPGFTTVTLLTLALGIGANTAIFSAVYGLLLRSLPFRDASRLVVLNETTSRVGAVAVSLLNFQDWRAQSRTIPEMAIVGHVTFQMTGAGRPDTLRTLMVSPNFLALVGIHPLLGRDLAASEENAGTAPVVLLSHAFWQSRFGGDREAVGRVLTLDGRACTIVGVLPAGFRWSQKVDLIQPIGVWKTAEPSMVSRGNRGNTIVVGRLASGMTVAQARAEMDGIAAGLARAYPEDNDQFGVLLQPLRERFVGELRPALLVLFGAVAFVLLVACANVANLFLMRGTGRAREMALRIAIGASRGRIAGQLLAESLVVALLGGLGGVALAAAGIPALVRLIPITAQSGASVSLDGAVLLFAAAVSLVSTLVFGLLPALHGSNPDLHSELKESGRATASAGRNRWRASLAAAEVALALVLLAGAGLMTKSLYRLLTVDSGFQAGHLLTMEISLRAKQYDERPAVVAFWKRLLEGVRALPGVESAALGTSIPLTGDHNRSDITIEGLPLPAPGSFPHPDYHSVSSGYTSTLGVRVIRGRSFVDEDRENALRVAMVNALAAQLFPGGDAVGKRFHPGRPSAKREPRWTTVIGVVADTKMYGLSNPARLEIYRPLLQTPDSEMRLLVKSAGDPTALIPSIRSVVGAIDREQPIDGISTMDEIVGDSVSTERTTLILLGLFSGLALALAAIGIYGVMAYSVAQRGREIGIRIALGAQRGDVLRLVLAQGGRIAAAGVVIGVGAAFVLTRFMSKLLFEVSPADPVVYGAAVIGLVLVAFAACYIPARRTLRVDPLVALRHE